jgi:hypothetical protein
MESLTMIDASARSVLQAVFGMGLLTFAMMVWMSAVRIRAVRAQGLGMQAAERTSDLPALLPASATRVADNYNNLMEAPTLFYAIAIAVVVAGRADGIQAASAWIFLGARALHSAAQATINIVRIRGLFYGISWLALATMIIHGAMTL